MSLSETEYIENGVVKDSDADGALSVTTYAAEDATTYYTAQGFLLDADGRLVVVAAS